MTHAPVAQRRQDVAAHAPHYGRDARVVASHVGIRLAALGIDIGIFILAAPFVLGLCAVALRELWPVGAITVAAAYVGGSWAASGQTLGMSMLGIRLVNERTRHAPSTLQALLCAALTLPPLIGGAVLLNSALVPGPSAVPQTILLLSGACFAMGLISTGFSFLDGGRMLHDRMCGVLAVRDDSRLSRSAARR